MRIVKRYIAGGRAVSLAAVVLLAGGWLWGQEAAGVTGGTDLTVQVSSLPELKVKAARWWVIPALRGEGALTRGNGVRATVTGEVSPVSVNGDLDLVLTPIAFMELSAGGQIGSGWNMALGNGIGITRPKGEAGDGPRSTEVSGQAFDGALWSVYGGAALQFDLGAVVPGDWSHVVARAYSEARYHAYTRAGAGDSWVFEADGGENRNGWVWNGSFLLGYRMPASPVLNMAAVMAEGTRGFYGAAGGSAWGDDLPIWTFSALLGFTVTPRLGATVAAQMIQRRNYGSSDLDNDAGYWYQDLKLSDDYGQTRLVFYRVALILTVAL